MKIPPSKASFLPPFLDPLSKPAMYVLGFIPDLLF